MKYQCPNLFQRDNTCLDWICECGHRYGAHAPINSVTRKASCCNDKCGCKDTKLASWGNCPIECLFKLKING